MTGSHCNTITTELKKKTVIISVARSTPIVCQRLHYGHLLQNCHSTTNQQDAYGAQ